MNNKVGQKKRKRKRIIDCKKGMLRKRNNFKAILNKFTSLILTLEVIYSIKK